MGVTGFVCMMINLILANTACDSDCVCVSGRCCVRDNEACPRGDQCSCKHVIDDWSYEVCEDADQSCAMYREFFVAMSTCMFTGMFVLLPLLSSCDFGIELIRLLMKRDHDSDVELNEIKADDRAK